MGTPPIALEGASIVFIGSFNPAIFHPSWYVAEGLWSKTELENAEVDVIAADIMLISHGAIHAPGSQQQIYDFYHTGTISTIHCETLQSGHSGFSDTHLLLN